MTSSLRLFVRYLVSGLVATILFCGVQLFMDLSKGRSLILSTYTMYFPFVGVCYGIGGSLESFLGKKGVRPWSIIAGLYLVIGAGILVVSLNSRSPMITKMFGTSVLCSVLVIIFFASRAAGAHIEKAIRTNV